MKWIMNRIALFALICLGLGTPNYVQAQDQPAPADPLTARIDTQDAERFAALWHKTGGHPTAAQLDTEYIAGSGAGVRLFVPLRNLTGTSINSAMATHPQWYTDAVVKCLPWVTKSTPDLRAIYLGLQGLLPERPLPQIYMLVGRGNTGGTAAPGAQLLGLEVLCREAATPAAFRAELRSFFAHETAHTFQTITDTPGQIAEPLLTQILAEGVADYVAQLVTGEVPDVAREAYGHAHERELWAQFTKDRAEANLNYSETSGFTPAGKAALGHWLYNGNRGRLDGWERDMGYWLGAQIAAAYMEHALDRHAAIRELLAPENPARILLKSGYGNDFTTSASGHR
jgi:hypothetical protein